MPYPRLPHPLLDNAELILSTVALVVIWAAPTLYPPASAEPWILAAAVATLLNVSLALVLWSLRRRQARVQARTIAEIREMLRDVVRNQLMKAELCLPSQRHPHLEAEALEDLRASLASIDQLVDTLSEESFAAWKTRYESALRTIARLEDSGAEPSRSPQTISAKR